MKVGIIRCMQTEDYCPGSTCFQMIREQKGAFAGQEDIEIVGFINCGGCPGKKRYCVRGSCCAVEPIRLSFPPASRMGLPLNILAPLQNGCGS